MATTIANNAVTNAKLAQMATNTIKGNNTELTANAIDLTVTQATAMLNAFVGDSDSGGTGVYERFYIRRTTSASVNNNTEYCDVS